MKGKLLTALLLVVSAVPAWADEGLRARYRFSATGPEGAFENGSLAFDGEHVRVTEEAARSWSGRARVDGRLVTITRAPSVGLARAVEGGSAAPALEYVALFDEDFAKARVRIYRGGVEVASGRLDEGKRFWERLPGDLLALARKEVDRAIHDVHSFSEEFSVLSYGHIGVRTGIELLADSERTPLMKEGDRLFREGRRAEPVWVRTFVEGGPRVAYSVSVPVDAAGTVRVDAGFQLGAKLRYTCDEPHPRPEGLTDGRGILDVIESVPVRTFALPLSADKALALPVGSRRTLEGDGTLAISGGVSLGYRLEELGVLKDKAEVGVHGGLGVTWSLRGDVALFVQRETGSLVRARWRRATHRAFSGGVHALVGAYVSEKLLDDLGQPASSGVKAIVRQGRKYTTIEFGLNGARLADDRLEIDVLFDLRETRARAAYEAAVRGDLTRVQELASDTDAGGLKEYRITSTLTDALTFNASFKAFDVLKFDTNRRSADVRVEVESLDGTTSTTDTFSYTRNTRGLFGGERSLAAEAIDRTIVHPAGAVDHGSRVTFHVEKAEDRTSRDEVDEAVELASRLFGEPAVAADRARIAGSRPYDRDRPTFSFGHSNEYGKTRLTVDVALGTRAIEEVLAAGDDAFFQAYGRASGEDRFEAWTPARRAMLDRVSLFPPDKDDPDAEAKEKLRHEAWAHHYAKDVAKLLQKARGAATSAKRVEAFRRLAKTDGFRMRGVLALALVADGSDCRVALSLRGDAVSFAFQAGDAAPLPEHR